MAYAEDKLNELELKAECLKAFTHPVRIMILQELAAGKKCVSELSEIMSIAQTTLSQHLSLLRSGGWIRREKKALFVYYSLGDSDRSGILKKMLDLINKLK